MIRKLKVLGLAIVAVTAMSALSASASQAAEFTTESGSYPVTYSGSQTNTHTFTIGTKTLTCAVASFHGSASAKSPSATVTPTYENCHTVILGATFDVTVTTNGCTFTFNAGADSTSPYDASTTVNCPTKPIEIHVYNGEKVSHVSGNVTCAYDVGAQTATGTPTSLTNVANGDVEAVTNGVVVQYTRTVGSTLACGAEKGSSEYNGKTVLAGTVGGVAANVHVK